MQQAATTNSSSPRQATAYLPLTTISPAQLSKALLSAHQAATTPLEELVATGAAIFELIRNIESIDVLLKMAFEQLEKQFVMYAELAGADQDNI